MEPVPDVFPLLWTSRLVLRELRDDDADALYQLFSDAAVTRYHDLDTFTEIAQAQDMIARMRQRFAERRGIRWGITRAGEDIIIGTGGFNRWSAEDRFAHLGYDLARSAWGHGLMTEAVGAIVRFGFERLGLNRIEAETMLNNNASVRVLEKSGFREEGILRQRYFWKDAFHDVRIFSLLHSDYDIRHDQER